MDDILVIRDVAKRLRLGDRAVQDMLENGELPGFVLRDQWRVRKTHFDRWLDLVAAGNAPASATAQIMTGAKPLAISGTNPKTSMSRKEGGSSMQQLTERVSQSELHRRFVNSLGKSVASQSSIERKPMELNLVPPLPSRVRVYIFNATRPPGGRPTGEHKVQLIMPGQQRGDRGQFDQSGGRIPLLVGYAAEEDVFILWDAGLYTDFAWSRNVQVKAETIVEAAAGKIARQERRLRPTDGEAVTETLLACPPSLLSEAIQLRQALTRKRLAGE